MDLSSISTIVAIVAIIWKLLSSRCDEKYTRMQYVAVWFQVLSGFFNSVAIVAIIWKLVVVKITQLFCSDRNDRRDRSDHTETTLKRGDSCLRVRVK